MCMMVNIVSYLAISITLKVKGYYNMLNGIWFHMDFIVLINVY